MMDVDELVDAAIVGLDRGEQVTIPSLPDVADWEAYEAALAVLNPEAVAQFSGTMLWRYRLNAIGGK